MDRTTQAVRRQLNAMRCSSYEVGILNASGKMLERRWTAQEVLAAIPWLKRANMAGSHIFIRPGDESHDLVFVDDLSLRQIESMKRSGHEPAIVVESSPGNQQVWVRLRAISGFVRRRIAADLAQRYQGDPNSAQTRHYGRLAGFTNRKPKHRQANGQYPWVLLRESHGTEASTAGELIADAERQCNLSTAPTAPKVSTNTHSSEKGLQQACDLYAAEIARLRRRYGDDMDFSRADWMAGRTLFERGHTQQAVEVAMRTLSPMLDGRKCGHVDDYVGRTVRRLAERYAVTPGPPVSAQDERGPPPTRANEREEPRHHRRQVRLAVRHHWR